ncbi:MAG TPA: 4a-hydroxytetrahydrobiopterin dehydratase [Candidatus Paceibacterota bacterium]|nr:4a-hydroxytetrahydrobiopterin dehydratase [Candidatus Paceibacterota bacterium]
MSLAHKKCKPCDGEIEKLSPEMVIEMMAQVPEWTLSEDGVRISRKFAFKDFARALAFTDAVGKLAEEEWHHPDIHLSWGQVEVTFYTHSIRGLAENDFIMAAKVDQIPR